MLPIMRFAESVYCQAISGNLCSDITVSGSVASVTGEIQKSRWLGLSCFAARRFGGR